VSEIVGEDWQWKAIERPAGGWKFKPFWEEQADRETSKALALFDKGDRYEVEGHKDWALSCDLRALRHLESAYLAKQGIQIKDDPSPIGIVASGRPRNG
jgi:hypothetical protein